MDENRTHRTDDDTRRMTDLDDTTTLTDIGYELLAESDRAVGPVDAGETVVVAGAGDELLAAGVADQEFTTRYVADAAIEDVAVGPDDLVYVVADGRICPVLPSGGLGQSWGIDEAVRAVAAIRSTTTIAAVTDGGELVLLDGQVGIERHRISLPPIGADATLHSGDEMVVCYDGTIVTAYDARKRQAFELDLPAPVTSLGLFDDRFLVALASGELRWYDYDGDLAETKPWDGETIAPRGEVTLFATGTDRGAVCDVDGNVGPVDVDADRLIHTTDGERLVTVDEGLTLYRRTSQPSATVESTTVTPHDPTVEVSVDNTLPVPMRVHFTATTPDGRPVARWVLTAGPGGGTADAVPITQLADESIEDIEETLSAAGRIVVRATVEHAGTRRELCEHNLEVDADSATSTVDDVDDVAAPRPSDESADDTDGLPAVTDDYADLRQPGAMEPTPNVMGDDDSPADRPPVEGGNSSAPADAVVADLSLADVGEDAVRAALTVKSTGARPVKGVEVGGIAPATYEPETGLPSTLAPGESATIAVTGPPKPGRPLEVRIGADGLDGITTSVDIPCERVTFEAELLGDGDRTVKLTATNNSEATLEDELRITSSRIPWLTSGRQIPVVLQPGRNVFVFPVGGELSGPDSDPVSFDLELLEDGTAESLRATSTVSPPELTAERELLSPSNDGGAAADRLPTVVERLEVTNTGSDDASRLRLATPDDDEPSLDLDSLAPGETTTVVKVHTFYEALTATFPARTVVGEDVEATVTEVTRAVGPDAIEVRPRAYLIEGSRRLQLVLAVRNTGGRLFDLRSVSLGEVDAAADVGLSVDDDRGYATVEFDLTDVAVPDELSLSVNGAVDGDDRQYVLLVPVERRPSPDQQLTATLVPVGDGWNVRFSNAGPGRFPSSRPSYGEQPETQLPEFDPLPEGESISRGALPGKTFESPDNSTLIRLTGEADIPDATFVVTPTAHRSRQFDNVALSVTDGAERPSRRPWELTRVVGADPREHFGDTWESVVTSDWTVRPTDSEPDI